METAGAGELVAVGRVYVGESLKKLSNPTWSVHHQLPWTPCPPLLPTFSPLPSPISFGPPPPLFPPFHCFPCCAFLLRSTKASLPNSSPSFFWRGWLWPLFLPPTPQDIQTGEGDAVVGLDRVTGSLNLGSHWPEPGVEGGNSGREAQGRAAREDRDRGP